MDVSMPMRMTVGIRRQLQCGRNVGVGNMEGAKMWDADRICGSHLQMGMGREFILINKEALEIGTSVPLK